MNLRDWQKKASERRNKLAEMQSERITSTLVDADTRARHFRNGFDSRDHEIDLLLQIIEKQSEAIEAIGRSRALNGDDTASARLARTTQAEVQGLVERLVKE
jgi:hypothetical protein